MKYYIARHVVERLMERTADTGVFDPRSRAIVDASSLSLEDCFTLVSAQLYRSHALPPRGQMLFRHRHCANWDLPAGQVVVRFDNCIYFLKEDSLTQHAAVSMLQATEEQEDILEIKPYELYVTIAGVILPPLRRRAQDCGLVSKTFELEDCVRRAVHFGVAVSWERVREILGESMTDGSPRWEWFAGPVAESWDEDHVLDRPLTLVVGVRYVEGCSQARAAYVLERKFAIDEWREAAVAVAEHVEEVSEVASTVTPQAVSRDTLRVPFIDGYVDVRSRSLLRLLRDVPHAGYVMRQLRRIQAVPLSAWGAYDLFGFYDDGRTAACLFEFGEVLPIPGHGVVLGYERGARKDKRWRFTKARLLVQKPEAHYLR